jgi:hypothetical protein
LGALVRFGHRPEFSTCLGPFRPKAWGFSEEDLALVENLSIFAIFQSY